MTATAPMTLHKLFDYIPEKIDTLLAAGAAAALGYQNFRLRSAQTKSAEIDPVAQQVDIIHKVGEDLRADLRMIRLELAECEKSKAAMGERIDKQGEILKDLTEALSRSMEHQGMTMKAKRPHSDDLTGA